MPASLSQIIRDPRAVVAFVFPVLILFGNKLLVAGVVGLAVAVLIWRRPKDWRAAAPFALLLGSIALWGAASAFWSIAPAVSLERAARLAGLALCGLVLCRAAVGRDAAARATLPASLLAGITAAAALSLVGLVSQRFVGESFLSALNQKPFAAVAAVLLVPAAGVLIGQGRQVAAAVGLLALATLFLWADSLAAVVAVCVAGVVFAAVYFGRRGVTHVVSAAVVAAIVAVPAVVAWTDSPSWVQARDIPLRGSVAHRVAVWDFVGQRSLERPLLGWGLGVARGIPGAEVNPLDRPRYRGMLLSAGVGKTAALRTVPLHPHNAVLHVLLELGIPGLILYLGLCLLCIREVLRSVPDRLARATGMATLAAAIAIGQVSFSVWQSWWIAAQFMLAAIFLALFRTES